MKPDLPTNKTDAGGNAMMVVRGLNFMLHLLIASGIAKRHVGIGTSSNALMTESNEDGWSVINVENNYPRDIL